MASTRKSAREKLMINHQPEVEVLDKPFGGVPAGGRLFISTPMMVKAYVEAIPKGETRSMADMREEFAKANGADGTCQLTAGIFVRLVTEAAMEELAEGKSLAQVSPFWRIVDRKSPVVKKLNIDPDWLDQLRANDAS